MRFADHAGGTAAAAFLAPAAVLAALRGNAWRARRLTALADAKHKLRPLHVPYRELGVPSKAARPCPRCEELCPSCMGPPDFSALQRLGSGEHAPVFRTTWRGLPATIKVTQFSDIGPFLNEVRALQAVSGHPNVVSIIGVNLDSEPAIIYHYAPGQSLHDVCTRRPRPLPFHLQVRIARQLAEAMAHLHSKGLMHRDLKSPNVVVDISADWTDCNTKLIDLGCARFLWEPGADPGLDQSAEGGRTLMEYLAPEEVARPATAPREPKRIVHPGRLHNAWLQRQAAQGAPPTLGVGTFDWMAPEMWLGSYGPNADVYSYAVVLYELATGRLPWADLPADDATCLYDQDMLKGWIEEGMRPHLPGAVRRPMVELIQRCWAGDAESRPSFAEIVDHLRDLEQYRDLWIDQWRAHEALVNWETMDMGC